MTFSLLPFQALVLAPTREIAVQGARAFLDVGCAVSGLKVHTLIGGMAVDDDIEKLRDGRAERGLSGGIVLVKNKFFSLTHPPPL